MKTNTIHPVSTRNHRKPHGRGASESVPRLTLSRYITISAADYEQLPLLGSLHEVGAWLTAVAAYCYGTSLDFARAMDDCSEDTRRRVLDDCLKLWHRYHLIKRRGKA